MKYLFINLLINKINQTNCIYHCCEKLKYLNIKSNIIFNERLQYYFLSDDIDFNNLKLWNIHFT